MIKIYKIKIGEKVYEVEVEAVTEAERKIEAASKLEEVKKETKSPPINGEIKKGDLVNAPMQGKILKINASAGASVKKGDVLLVLEAMKMENEICAPQDGTVATVECAAGDSVESGKVLVSMN